MAASYNCADSSNSAYGGGSYGTCATQTVGAPNTGVFGEVIDSAGFFLLAPIAAAIIVVGLLARMHHRKTRKQN